MELINVGIGQLRHLLGLAPGALNGRCARGRIKRVANLGALAHPVARIDVPPGDHVSVGDVSLELGGELGERQLLVVDQLRVPNCVEVGWLPEPGDLHVVAAFVAAFADVERLMKVADKMHHKAERELLVIPASVRILKRLAEAVERFERIALGRRMTVKSRDGGRAAR